MATKPQVTKTLNPLHLEDFEPHRFEDLIRQLSYDYRNWATIEAVGRLGNDDGLDIRASEIVSTPSADDDAVSDEEQLQGIVTRDWIIQCKRQKKVSPKEMEGIIREARGDISNSAPYGLIIAVACDVTKKTHDAFRQTARDAGFQEFDLWTRSRIEDLLFQPKNDHLLFAYFGISLQVKKRKQVMDIRKRLTIKQKIRIAFGIENDTDPGHCLALIRDIEAEEAYPLLEKQTSTLGGVPRWFPAFILLLGIKGLFVARKEIYGWVNPDNTWDIDVDCPACNHHMLYPWGKVARDIVPTEPDRILLDAAMNKIPEQFRQFIYVMESIPYTRIIEVDAKGDMAFSIPQIYCQYEGDYGPLSEKQFYFYRKQYSGLTQLDADKRVQLLS